MPRLLPLLFVALLPLTSQFEKEMPVEFSSVTQPVRSPVAAE